ncbi:MAG: dihydrofolate reductase family protein [bacterium]
MKCSVFIATSVDGFIAKKDGSVDWLHTVGKRGVDLGNEADMGMARFMASVDCMIMGRKTMDVINSMNLAAEDWPYGDTRIIVLSHSLHEPPKGMEDKIEIYGGDIISLMQRLEREGHSHAYVDGGTTIQAFIDRQLIDEMTITRVPVLLGEGIPLFGRTAKEVNLEQCSAKAFANDFMQEHYKLNYL